jgi:hypothetical protein
MSRGVAGPVAVYVDLSRGPTIESAVEAACTLVGASQWEDAFPSLAHATGTLLGVATELALALGSAARLTCFVCTLKTVCTAWLVRGRHSFMLPRQLACCTERGGYTLETCGWRPGWKCVLRGMVSFAFGSAITGYSTRAALGSMCVRSAQSALSKCSFVPTIYLLTIARACLAISSTIPAERLVAAL